MAIKYDLTPIEIIKLLGYTEPTAKEELELFEKENNLKLPKMLFDFLSLAKNNPLFSTADIWAQDDMLPYFSYEYIEEGIEECREDFEDPEFCEQNAFYPYSKIPKEQWSESVANYLQIGSDYGAGVAFLGIEEKDLSQENPPVYMLHEADELSDWKLIFPKLSDYLMGVLMDVLACADYNTAQYALNEKGWRFYENEYGDTEALKEALSQKNLDLTAMTKNPSCWNPDSLYRCCFHEEEKALYVIQNDESLLVIKAE